MAARTQPPRPRPAPGDRAAASLGRETIRGAGSTSAPHAIATPVGDAPVIPMIMLMTGVYLAWFGVHYWRDTATVWPTTPIKNLFTGKTISTPARETSSATSAALAAGITPSAAAAPSSTSSSAAAGGSGITAAAPAGGGETAWFTALLQALGAPTTQANLSSLHSWRLRESAWPPAAANNPLNTTLKMPGSSNFNDLGNGIGVQSYPDAQTGIEATARTLQGYSTIMLLLRSGRGLCGGQAAEDFRKWSGGGYSSVC